ncbi:hypothetical protein BJG93_32510 (plasmid) [Paraburkholderia sprentiae WSM5005]|uniref:Uncharacterized protein n=1 Tax=Paraburkholderia sprentiae WSM5005 TaxID=754502 RepID=A0ACA8AXE0_9BURK|nr:hypothetical protein [Paraburkholderia sprentiae]APA90336.1 hypothetical protein BJG93_32510 [Paraburkholderia sprentiae WSM5005]
MNMVDEAAHDVGELQADINYLEPGVDRPVSYMFDPPRGAARPTLALTSRRMPILDARPLGAAGTLGLDTRYISNLRLATVSPGKRPGLADQ